MKTLKLSDLKDMPPSERGRRLQAWAHAVRTAEPSRESATVMSIVKGFEAEFGFSSDELLERLKTGDEVETYEIGRWLFYLNCLRAR